MTPEPFTFVTDTSTLCICDVEAIRHRLNDDEDWWADCSEAIKEVRAGNALFIDLGEDGRFEIQVAELSSGLTANLRCPSGRVFIGAAEEVTSGGMEPECRRGGKFLTLEPGNYLVRIARADAPHRLSLSITGYKGPAGNNMNELVRL